MVCSGVLSAVTYAASDFARGTRAVVERTGSVEVAALARGLSVRVNDAIAVVVVVTIGGECVYLDWRSCGGFDAR